MKRIAFALAAGIAAVVWHGFAGVTTHNESFFTYDIPAGETETLRVVKSSLRVVEKTGAGTLCLAGGPIEARAITIVEGTVRVAKNVHIAPDAVITVFPGATLALDDGVVLPCAVHGVNDLLVEADIWVDAAALAGNDGTKFCSITNFGRAGGSFVNPTKDWNWSGTTGAPEYQNNVLNGRSGLFFNGHEAVQLTSYVNTDQPNITIFSVARWKDYAWDEHKGKYGGLYSFSSLTAGSADNLMPGAIHEEYSAASEKTLFAGSARKFNLTGLAAVGTVYQDTVAYGARSFVYSQYTGDAASLVTQSATQNNFPFTPEINLVCLGTRLGANGAYQPSRSFYGYLGEFLVFSRALTAEETALVEAYLRRKWFDSNATAAAPALAAPVPAALDVAAGTAVWTGTPAAG